MRSMRWTRVMASVLLALASGPLVHAADKRAPGPTPPAATHSAKGDPGDGPIGEGETGKEETTKSGSSLPIPRFVSLRTDPINLRTGPGVRYPVDWVYVRRRLPVEVIAEFDTWRQIRDPDGTEGWVHQSMLSGRRTGVITAAAATLRHDSDDHGASVATLEKGVVVNIQRCPATTDFCRVEVSGVQGWLKRDQMWGVYPTETVQ